ncbi:MAG: DNA polymerase I [Candidatus Neomarinimicrobiota bacterium]|nr:DNA polymerase I [Candidatus Neomarinimicrobiota bacterium]
MSLSKNNKKRLFIIDGYATLYRAHYALIKNPLKTTAGLETSAVFGFANQVFQLLEEENPDYIVAAFDSKGKNFRHELYEQYKANRSVMPDEIQLQLPYLWELLDGMNIPVLRKEGVEADDIIGTVAKMCEKDELQCNIVSGDKDFMQLINDKTLLYAPQARRKEKEIFDKDKVVEKWGVGPEHIIDLLGLMGDSSDNVPGVQGVGPVTAKKLILEFGSIENIYDNIDQISNEKLKEKLLADKDNALLSKKLVTILIDVPVNASITDFERKEVDKTKLESIFKELEFTGLLKKIGGDASAPIKTTEREKEYDLITTLKRLQDFADSIKEGEWLSVDLETTSVNPMIAEIVGFSFSVKKDTGAYVPIHYKDKVENLFGDNDLKVAIDILKPVLENEKIPKTGQNIKYDALIMKRFGIDLKGIEFDTMIAAHLISPNARSYKLDNLSLSYLNYKMVPIQDLIGSGRNQITMDQVDLADITFYAAEDADVVIELTEIFLEELKKQNLYTYFKEIEIDLLPVLIDMQFHGIFVDRNYLLSRSKEIGTKLDVLEKQIIDLAGQEFNINSTQQLAEILFDKLNLPMVKKRSTAEAVLNKLKDYHELPILILQYRKLFKLKNTYLDPLPDNINEITNRVHSSFNQTMTATGRLSTSNPNFQNIPIRTEDGKEVRKAIRAQSDEYQILSADYSQVELRVMAHLSKDESLIQALKDGEDIHTFTAKNIFNVKEGQEVLPDMRRIAKIVNFGIMYGAGSFRLSQELGIPAAESKKIIEAYFQKYKGIRQYMVDTKLLVRKEKSVSTLLGRNRAVWDSDSQNQVRRDAAERMAINMPIQGTAAEMIKIAMIKIDNDLKENNLKSKLILQIHDELLLEVHNNEIDYVKEMTIKHMKNAIELDVPVEIDCGVGPSWYEAH